MPVCRGDTVVSPSTASGECRAQKDEYGIGDRRSSFILLPSFCIRVFPALTLTLSQAERGRDMRGLGTLDDTPISRNESTPDVLTPGVGFQFQLNGQLNGSRDTESADVPA
jgi:hypothetical protein